MRCKGEAASSELRNLPRGRENAGSDHHAGAHRDRTQQVETALAVLG
ncbi:MAG: hypothetical protein ACJAYC_000649 [Halieaceae bacterium]|jgi:hypothetical protein